MVYFEKSQPSPTITSTHNTSEIVERLEDDFKNKCYICEEKNPKDINVEHFIAHEGNQGLKLDWNNLFLSCTHCNKIKSNNYNNLLNCTVLTDRVDTSLRYYCKPMPKEYAVFEILIPSHWSTRYTLIKYRGVYTQSFANVCGNLRRVCTVGKVVIVYTI